MTEEEEFFFESDIFLAMYSGASYEEAHAEALENLKDFREYKRANNACTQTGGDSPVSKIYSTPEGMPTPVVHLTPPASG